MDRYLLGIDYGGTVTKAAVFDSRGGQISVYSEKTEVVFPGDGARYFSRYALRRRPRGF